MVDNWVIKFSKSIGYFIITITGLVFIIQFISLPLEKATNICLTAFITIASLSAICYTALPCMNTTEDKKPYGYAAEKFLHASLLIIQSLFLKYAADGILLFEPIKNIELLHTSIVALTALILLFVSSTAVVFSALGFDELNKLLWVRFQKRNEKPFENNSQNYI